MTQNNEEKIKKIVKTQVGERKIKLKSAQILARFHAENEALITKPRRINAFQLKLGLSFISAFLVLGSLAYVAHAFSSTTDPSVTSSGIVPSEDHYNDKVAGGKEGEFIFMVASALLYANESTVEVEGAPRMKYYTQTPSFDRTTLEATLDQTLPLVEEIFEAKKGYQYKNNHGGAYHGKHGTYPNEYIINERIRIVLNVGIDDETVDTEIVGEVILDEQSYRLHGEKKGDKQKGAMNFALEIEYSNDAYLQITSKNGRDEQIFTYNLIVRDEQMLFVEIASLRRGQKNNRFVSVDVVYVGVAFHFEIERRGDKYFIEYDEYTITVTKNNAGEYVYIY